MMGKQLPLDQINRRVASVRSANKFGRKTFCELLKIADLDPAKDLRFANWSTVSFAGCDLSGYDFSGAILNDCNFSGARIANAIFTQSEIGVGSNKATLHEARDWHAVRFRVTKTTTELLDCHLSNRASFYDEIWAPRMTVINLYNAGEQCRFAVGARSHQDLQIFSSNHGRVKTYNKPDFDRYLSWLNENLGLGVEFSYVRATEELVKSWLHTGTTSKKKTDFAIARRLRSI
jgi:hypothetical protein